MAFDAYIRFLLPEVPGEVKLDPTNYKTDGAQGTAPGNEGWIDMTEYSFSTTMAVTAARSGGVGAATTGKGKLEPFVFKKNVDATSMSLAFHAAAGTVFKQITVNIFVSLSDGGATHKPHEFLTVNMGSAVINACKFSGGGGDDLPTEEINITYGTIEYKYTPFKIKEDGSVEVSSTASTFGWNTISNTGSKAA